MVILVTGDAGHGLYTPGKRTPDDEREWSFNDKVIRAFEAELNNYEGVAFKRLDDPTGQTDVPLKTRTDKANALGSKVHVSFHHNANVGTYWGNWGGVETFVYKTSLSDAMALAKAVHSKNVNAYGLRDRGIKPSDLHMLRETNMTAILTEGGFMDSTTDIGKLRNDTVLRNSGIAIAQGVASYLGLKRKSNPTPQPPTSGSGGNIGRLVVVDVPSLNVRSRPSWDDSAILKQVVKGQAFTILEELPEFYRCQYFYITKSTSFVHVK